LESTVSEQCKRRVSEVVTRGLDRGVEETTVHLGAKLDNVSVF